jgi:hypothetical protein
VKKHIPYTIIRKNKINFITKQQYINEKDPVFARNSGDRLDKGLKELGYASLVVVAADIGESAGGIPLPLGE